MATMTKKEAKLAAALWEIKDETSHALNTEAEFPEEVFEVNMREIRRLCKKALKKYSIRLM